MGELGGLKTSLAAAFWMSCRGLFCISANGFVGEPVANNVINLKEYQYMNGFQMLVYSCVCSTKGQT